MLKCYRSAMDLRRLRSFHDSRPRTRPRSTVLALAYTQLCRSVFLLRAARRFRSKPNDRLRQFERYQSTFFRLRCDNRPRRIAHREFQRQSLLALACRRRHGLKTSPSRRDTGSYTVDRHRPLSSRGCNLRKDHLRHSNAPFVASAHRSAPNNDVHRQ